MNLRPYQTKLINGLRSRLAAGDKRIIAYLPTGAGKTLTACGIVHLAQEKDRGVAFICNRTQLIAQTSSVFDSVGITHGILQGDNTRDIWRKVKVCSVQTIRARGGIPGMDPERDLIIIDECHGVAGTQTYHELMREYKYVVGLTATPYQKGLGRHMPELKGKLFESVVVGASMREMIEGGFLVDADVWAPSEPDLNGVKIVAGDYHEQQLGQAMNKPKLVGDIVDHWLRLAPGSQTMAFCVTREHSKSLRDAFLRAGVHAVHVDYTMSDEEKHRIYDQFREQEFRILCNCALLSEGADFPACSTLILARPTRSKVRYVQMFGRVLRPYPGKARSCVLDHSGSVLKLGMPWDFSVTHLCDGKPNKSSASEPKEREVPQPKACSKCAFVKPAGVRICPQCGFEPRRSDVEQLEGELVQVRGKSATKSQELAKMGRQAIYSQLLWVANEKGYNAGWAKHKYRAIFGTWPNRQDDIPERPCGELLAYLHHLQIKWAKARK